jgi:hypothetical protein
VKPSRRALARYAVAAIGAVASGVVFERWMSDHAKFARLRARATFHNEGVTMKLISWPVLMLGVLLSAGAPAVQGAVCQLNEAQVKGVFQWEDGDIFVELDRPVGCGCAEGSRVAFHKDDGQRLFMAMALTAATSGRTVELRADNVNGTCPVHNNTARLLSLKLRGL